MIRVLVALSLVALCAAPRPAQAEAGPTARLHGTAGHTSLLVFDLDEAPSVGASAPRSAAELWLHGDHGTLRQTVRGAKPGASIGLFAGVGDVHPVHSGLFAGRIPALWTSAPLITPPLATPAGSDLRVWRWQPAVADFAVAWTVPHAGDSWGLTGQRDCGCGSPVETLVMHTGLTVDVGEVASLTVHNRAGVAVVVFGVDGRTVRIPSGGSAAFAAGSGMLTFSFVEGWVPPADWHPPLTADALAAMHHGQGGLGHAWDAMRLVNRCEVVGTGALDEVPLPKRGQPLTVRCSTLRGTSRSVHTRRLPASRSLDAWNVARPGHDGAMGHGDRPHAGFTADVLRESVAPRAPRRLSAWPALGRRRTLTHNKRRWTALDPAALSVRASSTLASRSDRYAAEHLLDGDPTTAWCEGVAGAGLGESLQVAGAPGDRPLLVALVPGYARADWHFAVNGAPVALRGPFGEPLRPIRLPDSADLYREGQALEVVAVLPAGAPVELALTAVRAGRMYDDTCISELLLFE